MSLITRLLGLDQFVNVLLGGDNPDETISSAVGRKALEGRVRFRIWEFAIDMLFLARTKGQQRRHCLESIEWDELTPEQMDAAMGWKP